MVNPNHRNGEEESYGSSSSSSSSSDNEEVDSDESAGIPLSALGVSSKQRSTHKTKMYDSEDSYKPNRRGKKMRKKGRKRKRKQLSLSQSSPRKGGRAKRSKPSTTRRSASDHEEQTYEEGASVEEDEEPVQQRKRPRTNGSAQGGTTSAHNTRSNRRFLRAADESEDSEESSRAQRRRGRYESDHSYHLESSKRNKGLVLESDTDNEVTRSTRSSLKKAQNEWARDEEGVEEEEEEEEEVTVRRYRRRGVRVEQSDSDNSQTDIQNQNSNSRSSYRSLRSRRRRLSPQEDPDQEIDSDDQPLSQQSIMSTNRTRSSARVQTADSSSVNGSSTGNPTLNRFRRRFATTTTTRSQSTEVSTQLTMPPAPHEIDHNYGEREHMGTRRRQVSMLSRHQRNADELDPQQENDNAIPSTSSISRLRVRTNVNGEGGSTVSRATSTATQITIRRAVRGRIRQEDATTAGDETDPEDNTPLMFVASSSRSTRSGVAAQRDMSDEDPSPGPSSYSRRTRKLRRLQYNEDSDSTEAPSMRVRTKRRLLSDMSYSPTRSGANMPQSSRNLIPEEPESDSGGDQTVSISSRGRIRKITAKARGLFRE